MVMVMSWDKSDDTLRQHCVGVSETIRECNESNGCTRSATGFAVLRHRRCQRDSWPPSSVLPDERSNEILPRFETPVFRSTVSLAGAAGPARSLVRRGPWQCSTTPRSRR